ncbi:MULTISPECIES: DUF4345 domain-containing protein [unclassified Marinomonas]|uniref:DUF4345 domain-containing protein n=1 Tax=unclassified Marinomonas TaxID=196814 RepID=UPI001E49AD01
MSAFGGLNASAGVSGMEMIFDQDSLLRGFADNQYRFGYGVFFTQGLVLAFFLTNIEKHTNLFRFALLALFIGGIARVTNIMEFGIVSDKIVPPTIIEFALVPLLILWHLRVARKA